MKWSLAGTLSLFALALVLFLALLVATVFGPRNQWNDSPRNSRGMEVLSTQTTQSPCYPLETVDPTTNRSFQPSAATNEYELVLHNGWRMPSLYSYRRDDQTYRSIYFQNCGSVWYVGAHDGSYIRVPNSDPDSFEVLAFEWVLEGDVPEPGAGASPLMFFAKDAKQVYAGGRNVIYGADPATFEVLRTLDAKLSVFQADKDHVYRWGTSVVLEGEKPSDFKIVSPTHGIGKREYLGWD